MIKYDLTKKLILFGSFFYYPFNVIRNLKEISLLMNILKLLLVVQLCYGTVRIVSSGSIRNTMDKDLTYSVMNQDVA